MQRIDALAIQRVAALYRRLLRPGVRVLDLMSSWVSHLPDDLTDLQVTGLGLNQRELATSPRLAACWSVTSTPSPEFSERWFPPKVVRLWTKLHPFERMDLVLGYCSFERVRNVSDHRYRSRAANVRKLMTGARRTASSERRKPMSPEKRDESLANAMSVGHSLLLDLDQPKSSTEKKSAMERSSR